MSNRWKLRPARFIPALMIIITVFSQFKWDYQGIMRYALYGIWIITFMYFLATNKGINYTNFGLGFLISVFILALMCGICVFAGEDSYLELVMLSYMPISCFAYFCGVMIPENNDSDIEQMLYIYVFSSVGLAILIRMFNFTSMDDWYSSNTYIYAEGKNQIGMILASAIIIALFLVFPRIQGKLGKIFPVLCALIMLYIIAMVQCRTALIALGIAIGYGLLVYRKLKFRYIVLICLACVFLFSNDTVWTFIDHVFFISKYSGQDANAMLSGRPESYLNALQSIKNNLFFGVGDYYVDCLFLQILAEGGLFEFCIVFPVYFTRMKRSICDVSMNEYNSLYGIAAILAVYYLVTSFLEAQTPFGPGTSSCVFWMLSGYLDACSYDTSNAELTQ